MSLFGIPHAVQLGMQKESREVHVGTLETESRLVTKMFLTSMVPCFRCLFFNEIRGFFRVSIFVEQNRSNLVLICCGTLKFSSYRGFVASDVTYIGVFFSYVHEFALCRTFVNFAKDQNLSNLSRNCYFCKTLFGVFGIYRLRRYFIGS